MKRYLLLLLGIMIAAIAMASDVITKKNGTTIQCKVVKIGRTEAEYRPVTNLDGPIYAIDLTEISNIKYENGAVDNFGEQSVIATNSGQRTMTDEELSKLYNKMKGHPGRGWKTAGFIFCGIGILSTIDAFLKYSEDSDDTGTLSLEIGIPCLAIGAACFYHGHKKAKEINRYRYTSLFEQDFLLNDNSMLTANINIINDNISQDKSLGLGMRFTF